MHIGVLKLTTDFSPSWVPTCTHVGTQNLRKARKTEVPEGAQKTIDFHGHFCVLLVLSWGQLSSKLAPKTAQDGAQERPRAARDGARDGRETLWEHKAYPRRLGPPKITRRTLQNEPILINLTVHPCRFSTHF